MASRYETIKKDTVAKYYAGGPLAIVATALLKDNVQNSILVQAKYLNISDKTIIGCIVDVAANMLGGDSTIGLNGFAYLDMEILPGGEFGSKIPIVLPDNRSRDYSLTIKEVVFSDDTKWTNSNAELLQLPFLVKVEDIFKNAVIVAQYHSVMGNLSDYYPHEEKDLFLCTCGAIWNKENQKCYKCKRSYDLLSSVDNAEFYWDLIDGAYNSAIKLTENNTEEGYKSALSIFRRISNLKDVNEEIEYCQNRINEIKALEGEKERDIIYHKAEKLVQQNTLKGYELAISYYKQIPGWKDSDSQLDYCRNKIDTLKDLEKKKKKSIILFVTGVCITSILVCILVFVGMPAYKYNNAKTNYNVGKYEEAIKSFTELGDYGDSQQMILNARYGIAKREYDAGNYESAIRKFTELGDYMDSKQMIIQCEYDFAKKIYEIGNYDEAIEMFTGLREYSDSQDMIVECKSMKAKSLLNSGEYQSAYALYMEIGDLDSVYASKYDRAMELVNFKEYEEALSLLDEVEMPYKDVEDKKNEIINLMKKEMWENAKVDSTILFGTLNDKNIEWRILEKKDGEILVISKDVLFLKGFADDEKNFTWEKCTLRKYLNNDFISECFSNEEQKRIISTKVKAEGITKTIGSYKIGNNKYGGDNIPLPGNDTIDKVFLLSAKEEEIYNIGPAEYEGKDSSYWLRSTGKSVYYGYDGDGAPEICYLAEGIDANSGRHCLYEIFDYGVYSHSPYPRINGVRPSMWISVD